MNKDVPTIIIGLGGIGSEIACKAEQQMRKDTTKQDYKRKNVRFVIVDTDINSIREREESGYKGYSVRLSSNISVSNCLEQDEEAKTEWFPDNKVYYRKSISEGAGQVRSISRLALQRAIRTGMLEPLYNAIRDLALHNSNLHEQELKILVVSTIAGGTGSGALLPLGMHIKDYLNRKYSGSGAKINAFLILPDILYDVIPSKKEKRNLNANSYAVVKEIDALINGTSKQSYATLPNESDEETKQFRECPFDFCFLFNKLSRQKIVYGNIADYKDVIARCLYTQFLGTLASEYFSKEDNVLHSSIREISIDEKPYERFAGAGCSIVRYPYAEIREYLSLCWMKDIMKKEWVKYDERRLKIRRSIQERQEQGEEVNVYSDREAFLLAVAEVDKKEKEEGKGLLSCEEKLNQHCRGTAEEGLLEELRNYIEERIEQKRGDVKARIEDGYEIIDLAKIKGISNQREHLKDYLILKTELEAENERIYMSLSGVIEREICCRHQGDTKTYYLEYYIKNSKGEYESPNYIRFYLYKLEKELEDRKRELEREIEALKDSHKGQSEMELPVNRLRKNGIKWHMQEKYNLYMEIIGLLEKELENHCIAELIRYVHRISENYERFFREYDRLLILTDQRKAEMEKRFDSTVHRMEHWVYSGNDHLQRMLLEMKLRSEYYTVGGKISEWLYLENEKQDRSSFGESLTEQYENVKGMWEDQFEKSYGDQFNINVLKALEEESKRKRDDIIDYQHVLKRLTQAKNMASILLVSCRRPDIKTRKYCIYPSKILEIADCDENVREFFTNGMSFSDSNGLDVDEKQIVFLEIAYGFLPSDIDFFSDIPGVCADYPIGSGAQSYKRIVEHFCPDDRDAEITPHIDRRWHRKEFLDVNWDMPPFTLRFWLIICILYIKTLSDSTLLSANDQDFSQNIEKEYDECYKMREQELHKKLDDVFKYSKDELNKMWGSNAKTDSVEAMLKKIKMIHDIMCEKWCHSHQGGVNLKKEMENVFEGILENAEWIAPEILNECKMKWEKM